MSRKGIVSVLFLKKETNPGAVYIDSIVIGGAISSMMAVAFSCTPVTI